MTSARADQVLGGLRELGGAASVGGLQRLLGLSFVHVVLALKELQQLDQVRQVPDVPCRWCLVDLPL